MVYVRPQETLEVNLDQMGSWKELADYLKFLFSLMMAYSGCVYVCVCVCVCVCVYSHAFSLETFQMDSELLSSCKAMSTSGTLLIFYLCYLIYCFGLPPWCSGKESNFKSCKTMGQRQALK